jgi:hypothetical protein
MDRALKDKISILQTRDHLAKSYQGPFWNLVHALEELSELYPSVEAALDIAIQQLEYNDIYYGSSNVWEHF